MSAYSTYLALDLEFNQPSRKIIQVGIAIGAIEMPSAQFITRKWYLDPGEPVAPAIEALTGISDADIQRDSVSWGCVAHEIGGLIEENACFVNPVTWGGGDSEALLANFRQYGVPFPHFGRRWIDIKTWHVCQALANGQNPNGGLSRVMARYGLPFQGLAHRADVDAFNTLRLYFKLIEIHQRTTAVVRLAQTIKP